MNISKLLYFIVIVATLFKEVEQIFKCFGFTKVELDYYIPEINPIQTIGAKGDFPVFKFLN